jgi:hypothetical protein
MNLGQKALGADGGGDVGMQDLDRHGSVMTLVVSEVDRGHSSGAKLSFESVLAGEGGGKTRIGRHPE